MDYSQARPTFASFLDELAKGIRDSVKWNELIVTHYFDERLENIRRDVARMVVNDSIDAEQLRAWANELRNKNT